MKPYETTPVPPVNLRTDFKACIHVMGPLNAIEGLYTGSIHKSQTQVQTTAERRDFNRSEECFQEVINDFA